MWKNTHVFKKNIVLLKNIVTTTFYTLPLCVPTIFCVSISIKFPGLGSTYCEKKNTFLI